MCLLNSKDRQKSTPQFNTKSVIIKKCLFGKETKKTSRTFEHCKKKNLIRAELRKKKEKKGNLIWASFFQIPSITCPMVHN